MRGSTHDIGYALPVLGRKKAGRQQNLLNARLLTPIIGWDGYEKCPSDLKSDGRTRTSITYYNV
jgi:hypothetical protein